MPAVDTRKRPSSKVTDGVLGPGTKRLRAGGVSHRELERLKSFAHGADKGPLESVETDGIVIQDLWDQGSAALIAPAAAESSFLEPVKPVKEPQTLKRAPVTLSASGKEIPAVKTPRPEASYNPQSTEYFEALIRKGEREVQTELKRQTEAELEEEKLARAKKAREAAEEHEKRIEYDDYDEGDESEWEGIQSEREDRETSLGDLSEKKRPELQRKKTRAQRNRIARRKELERKMLAEEKMKRLAKQAAQVQQIVTALDDRQLQKVDAATTTAGVSIVNKDDDEESSSSGDDEVALRKKRFGKAPYVRSPNSGTPIISIIPVSPTIQAHPSFHYPHPPPPLNLFPSQKTRPQSPTHPTHPTNTHTI